MRIGFTAECLTDYSTNWSIRYTSMYGQLQGGNSKSYELHGPETWHLPCDELVPECLRSPCFGKVFTAPFAVGPAIILRSHIITMADRRLEFWLWSRLEMIGEAYLPSDIRSSHGVMGQYRYTLYALCIMLDGCIRSQPRHNCYNCSHDQRRPFFSNRG